MSESKVVAETRRIANRARSWTEVRMRVIFREEWDEILDQLLIQYPSDSPGFRRTRAFTILRHRHRRKWNELHRMAVLLAKEQAGWQDGRRNNAPKIRPRPTLRIVCPYCCADVGQRCELPSGKARTDHTARINAVGKPQLLHSMAS